MYHKEEKTGGFLHLKASVSFTYDSSPSSSVNLNYIIEYFVLFESHIITRNRL